MALNKGIWDPKLRGTNIKGTNLKSLRNSLTIPGDPSLQLPKGSRTQIIGLQGPNTMNNIVFGP